MNSQLLFTDYFEVDQKVLDRYGALNICLAADLPLFIDPFLLFASEKPEYQSLHDQIVNHLIRLKKHAVSNPNVSLHLFQFPEVRQNWLGWCKWGNNGKGLGNKFATNIIKAFNGLYSNFGSETVITAEIVGKRVNFSRE